VAELGEVLRASDKSLLALGHRSGLPVVIKALRTDEEFWQAKFTHEIRLYQTFTENPPPVRVPMLVHTDGRSVLVIEPHQAQLAARTEQNTTGGQAKYAIRAGVESTMHQAVTACGARHTRYRGSAKTHLQHTFSAVALNLIRLDAWWTDHPLDRTRTSHLTRLDLTLAA
jgi:hypothetical protein